MVRVLLIHGRHERGVRCGPARECRSGGCLQACLRAPVGAGQVDSSWVLVRLGEPDRAAALAIRLVDHAGMVSGLFLKVGSGRPLLAGAC